MLPVSVGYGDVCNVVQVQCTWTHRRAIWFGRRKWGVYSTVEMAE